MTDVTNPISKTEKYTSETITWIHTWTPNLFSFRTTRAKAYRFIPGQFARLGVKKYSEEKGEYIVWRAYSIASASYDEYLEFYSIVVPNGEFTSELVHLQVGDTIYVEKMNYGFLTTDRFEQGKDLWMLSTGTGLAPFLSILLEAENWENYEKLILVHSVRYYEELAYADWVHELKNHEYFGEMFDKLVYVPIITRPDENNPKTIHGQKILNERITTAIENGTLETAINIPLCHERSRIMICGNPDMVNETRLMLDKKGYKVSKRGSPAHMAVENYW